MAFAVAFYFSAELLCSTLNTGTYSWFSPFCPTDGSFLIVVADAGVYVSVNDGDSWTKYTPGTDDYVQTSCARTTGRAVVLGNTNREDGKIWTTIDYGSLSE